MIYVYVIYIYISIDRYKIYSRKSKIEKMGEKKWARKRRIQGNKKIYNSERKKQNNFLTRQVRLLSEIL